MTGLLHPADAVAHELVGRLYSLLRLASLLEAVERRGDQVVLTMSVRAYQDLLDEINAAQLGDWESLEMPEARS